MKRFVRTLLVVTILLTSAVPFTPSFAQSNETTISVSVPSFWKDIVGEDFVTAFEEQYGVDVYINYEDGLFNRASAVDDLDTFQEDMASYASSADVVYIDDSLLTPDSIAGGYFLDLSPLVSTDTTLNSGDFVSGAWQTFQWNNGFWGIPTSLDIAVISYLPSAFDAAGLPYPNASWTIADFANAARKLTVYDASGAVTTPGMSTGFEDLSPVLIRSLLGHAFHDGQSPSFSDPALQEILTTLSDLETEGVLSRGVFNNSGDIPLRLSNSRELNLGPRNQDANEQAISLLPGNVAGLTVQGFAVSSGTLFPELAYQLAIYLSSQPEVANNFLGIAPARQNIEQTNSFTGTGGSGPGGGGFQRFSSPLIEAILPEALANGLPASELYFSDYLGVAVNSMQNEGLDAQTALQNAEALAFSNLQTLSANPANLVVDLPPAPVQLAAGEIALNFAVSSSFGGGGRIIAIGAGGLPNQERWDQVIADFVANDPQVGAVNLESSNDDLSTLTETYDCFSLGYNAVTGSDLGGVLSLDPFIDTDVSFDRNDVIGTTLAQLQVDNRTWAIPLALQPDVLRYNTNSFNQAGIPLPENGWTTDQFIDALNMLKASNPNTAPFQPSEPGSSVLMTLIAAFGGLPIDYRTDPATINFTDPNTVNAIRQVLDLAKNGYIQYSELSANEFVVEINDSDDVDPIALTTDRLSPFSFRRITLNGDQEDPTEITAYPRGNQYNAISYQVTTGYISASSQNPDACYRFLSTLASHPELYSAMPARFSLINDSAITATQGSSVVAAYNEIANLIASPNTIVMPSGFRAGASPSDFLREYWLNRAFDRYVLEDADLEFELSEAQTNTLAFMECVNNLPPQDTAQQGGGGFGGRFDDIRNCALTADPTFEGF